MKIAVSIPDQIFLAAEKLALRLAVSRNEVYTRALVNLIEKHREELITAQLNQVYGPGGEESSLCRKVALVQSRFLPRGSW